MSDAETGEQRRHSPVWSVSRWWTMQGLNLRPTA
jgi:hypothetical protein